jgi:hypothetical protein
MEERMRRTLLLTGVMLILATVQAHAEFYTWTDKDGKEFYTNEKEKIPAEYRGTARPVEVREDRVSVQQKPAAGGTAAGRTTEHKDKHGRGEDYWRKRAQKLRHQLREQQDEHDVVVKQIAEQEKKGASTSSLKKRKQQLDRKIARTRHELEVELPDEVRKANGYPGWIRE